MAKEFKTWVEKRFEAYIDSDSVARILDDERKRLIGGKDRYILNGKIYESGYFNSNELIREATENEMKLYEALSFVRGYFRNLKED